MNPVVAAVLANNKADIKAIVEKIGVEALLELSPHFVALAETATKTSPPDILAVVTNNRADIKAIIDKIGVDSLLDLAPHFVAIAATASKQPHAG